MADVTLILEFGQHRAIHSCSDDQKKGRIIPSLSRIGPFRELTVLANSVYNLPDSFFRNDHANPSSPVPKKDRLAGSGICKAASKLVCPGGSFMIVTTSVIEYGPEKS